MIKDQIFKHLPIFFKSLALSAYSFLQSKSKYGKFYKHELITLRQNYQLPLKEVESSQASKLLDFLILVYEKNNFYRLKFNNAGLYLPDIKEDPLSALLALPILEKDFLKSNVKKIASSKMKSAGTLHTSGTSGSPMSLPCDAFGIQTGFAYWRRFYDSMGLPNKFVNARFSGRVIVNDKENKTFWVKDIYENRYFFSTYHLHDQNLKAYIKKLNQIKPELIDGYPSAISILARFIIRNDIELKFIPKAVAVTAETLLQADREAIERAFKTKVFNQYASSEGAPFITECNNGKLHLNLDTGIFEFHKINNSDSMLRELVVTSFRNRLIPLIRYRIGDLVVLSSNNEACKCGCNFPTIDSIQGRMDDLLFSSERGIIGRLDPVFKGIQGIDMSQIIQDGKDSFIIKIKENNLWSDNELLKLRENFLQRVGKKVTLKISLVEDLDSSANNKFKSVINSYKKIQS